MDDSHWSNRSEGDDLKELERSSRDLKEVFNSILSAHSVCVWGGDSVDWQHNDAFTLTHSTSMAQALPNTRHSVGSTGERRIKKHSFRGPTGPMDKDGMDPE